MKIGVSIASSVLCAVAISLALWYLIVTPYGRLPMGRETQNGIVRALDYPVEVAARLTNHSTGLGSTCCFCSWEQLFRRHMEIAVPTYTLLFLIPTLGAAFASDSR